MHARNPLHRIDVVESDRHVTVSRDGVTLADSRAARELSETGHRTRWYLPPQDVRLDLLERSSTTSVCPYKGTASYYALDGEDVAWVYEEPLEERQDIAGLIAFYDNRVDVQIA